MDQAIAAVVAGIIPVLSPYLPTIADKAAGKIGEELPSSIVKLWQSSLSRFSKNEASREAISDLQANASDPDLHAAFRVQLRKLLETDPSFRTELEDLLGGLPQVPASPISQAGIANINVHGTANTVDQRIGHINHTVTNVGYQPKQIPPELASEFVAQMRSVPPIEVHITSNMLDVQTQFLANQLTDLLQKAGWQASGDSQSLYGPEVPKGIVFFVPPVAANSSSLEKLARFLRRLGFVNYMIISEQERLATVFVNRA